MPVLEGGAEARNAVFELDQTQYLAISVQDFPACGYTGTFSCLLRLCSKA